MKNKPNLAKKLNCVFSIDKQVTGRSGLVCPKHGNNFNSHCTCGYRKMCSHRLSMDGGTRNTESGVKLDKSTTFYSVKAVDHNHTFPLSAATSKVFENSAGNGKNSANGHKIYVSKMYENSGPWKSSANGQRSYSHNGNKRKITLTLRDLTHFYPATEKEPNSVERFNSDRKQWKAGRPLGFVHSLQLLMPSKSLPSLTTTTTTTPTTTTTTTTMTVLDHRGIISKPLEIKQIKHERRGYDRERSRKERVNYCDREKTEMILKWLKDLERD